MSTGVEEGPWGKLGSWALLTGNPSQPGALLLEYWHCPSLPRMDTAMLDPHFIPSKTIQKVGGIQTQGLHP